MFCYKCRKKLPDNAKFCVYCGSKIDPDLQGTKTTLKRSNHRLATYKSRSKITVLIIAVLGILSITFVAGFIIIARPWKTISAEVEVTGSSQNNSDSFPIDISTLKDYTGNDFAYYIKEDGTGEITSYLGNDANIIIPESINGTMISSIGERAFEHCEMTSLEIPGTIVTIKENAFRNCSYLKELTLKNGIENIEGNAFTGCISIPSIYIPRSVKRLAVCQDTIKYIISDIKVVIDKDNPYLELRDGALYSWYQNSLTFFDPTAENSELIIPEGIERIGASACIECKNLQRVVFPDTLSYIDERAFDRCENLQNVENTSSVLSIGEYAFSKCKSLQSFNLNNGIEIILKGAFNECTSLTSIDIPDTVVIIGESAFNGDTALENVKLSRNLKTIELNAFQDCKSLTSIDLPDGLERIEMYAFAGSGIKTFYIPETVTFIGEYAFYAWNFLRKDSDVVVKSGSFAEEYFKNSGYSYRYY